MSGMPWQLREGLKRRVKGAPPRPIVEQLPAIAVHHLKVPDLYDEKVYTLPNISLRWPFLVACRLSREAVEFHVPSLHRGQPAKVQTFGFKHIRTGFGIRRAFICECDKPVLNLYFHNRYLGCQYCHRAIRASQALNQHDRPVLQASRLESFLNSKSRLFHRSKERLRKKLGEKVMLAQRRLGTRAHSLLD